MNIKEAYELLPLADAVGHVPLLVGHAGLGKTEVVKQYAKENDLHCEILMISLVDEGDLLGLPYRQGISTKWAQPVWFTRIQEAHSKGKRSVLFMDELNRGDPSVIGASLQLLLDRRLNEHQLPLSTFVVAAINPEKGDYVVNSLDTAVLDRLIVCEVEADVSIWLQYAKSTNVNTTIIEFISKSPRYLHFTPTNGTKGTSPRSWSRLSSYLNYVQNNKLEVNSYYVKGTIGETLAAEFLLFLKDYTKSVSIEDIINKVTKAKNRGFGSLVKGVVTLTKKVEAITKQDLADSLIQHYLSDTPKATFDIINNIKQEEVEKKLEEKLPLIVYLHSLPTEILASYLHNLRHKDSNSYQWIVLLDKQATNKQLFKKLVNKITTGE